MSLILCRQEPVRHPFYIERLGVHIASSQELCYVIYQNPLLALDGFVDDRLIEFIRSELGLSFLAGKLEAWQRSGESQDELPIVILQECCYYTAKEIAAYRQKLAAFRKMNAAEFRKETADYYFRLRQFGTAIYYYNRILEDWRGKLTNLPRRSGTISGQRMPGFSGLRKRLPLMKWRTISTRARRC